MPLSPAFGRKERKLGFFLFPLSIFQVIVTPLDATLTSRIIRYTPKRTGAPSTRPAGTWPSTASKRRRLSLVILDLRLIRGLLGIEHARTHARQASERERRECRRFHHNPNRKEKIPEHGYDHRQLGRAEAADQREEHHPRHINTVYGEQSTSKQPSLTTYDENHQSTS